MYSMDRLNLRRYGRGDDALLMDIEFHDNGLTLKGDAYIPIDMSSAVVFCHGFGQNHHIVNSAIKRVISRDMGVVKMTYPGHLPVRGEVDPEKSAEYTRALVDELPGILFTDNIILSGFSTGGYYAMRAAAGRNDIKGIALFSPLYDVHGSFAAKRRYRWMLNHSRFTDMFLKRYINKPWKLNGTDTDSAFRTDDFKCLAQNLNNKNNNPVAGEYAKDISCPVIIFHGKEDSIIPYSDSERLRDDLVNAGADARLVPLEGADHNILEKEHDVSSVRHELKDWLKGLERHEEQGFIRKVSRRFNERMDKMLSRRLREGYLEELRIYESHVNGSSIECAGTHDLLCAEGEL